jgi:hypothetical protein
MVACVLLRVIEATPTERTIFHQGFVGPWLLLLIESVPPPAHGFQKRCCAAMAQPRRKRVSRARGGGGVLFLAQAT